MFEITKLKTTLENINGGSSTVKVTGVREWWEYKNGTRTDKQLGYNYKVVLIGGGYDKINVKIQGRATITQADLDNSNGSLDAVIEGYIGQPYKMANGDYDLSGTATSITSL